MSGSEFDGAAAPLRMLTAQRQTRLAEARRAGWATTAARHPFADLQLGVRSTEVSGREGILPILAGDNPTTNAIGVARFGSSPYAIR